jgi:DNA helicase-2/ATP-dependent DNA helicase PcrA
MNEIVEQFSLQVPEYLLEGLNSEQREAVVTLSGPLAVVAGPGSGKTTVLTRRIAALMETGSCRAYGVLAMTFTNKAAGEMKQRVGVLLGEERVKGMWICTFHSFCARVLRVEHLAAGLPRAYTILDSKDVRVVLKGVVDGENMSGAYDTPAKVRELAARISRIKNGGRVIPEPQLLQIYDAYCKQLVRLGALDFDDLLLRVVDLFEKHHDIMLKYQTRFTHILVDEYQDTNPVQYSILQSLSADNGNLCVVGDADQSIYGFRSASPEVLDTFVHDWPGARVVRMGINYRSTQKVLDVCKSIIAGNDAKFRPELTTNLGIGNAVKVICVDDPEQEADFIATDIKKLDPNKSVAVLMRTNSQTRWLEAALPIAGLTYTTIGTLRFYDRAEIKDTFSYLRLILNPQDALALIRASSAPKRGLGQKSIEQIITRANGNNLLDTIQEMLTDKTISGKRGETWTSFLADIDNIKNAIISGGPDKAIRCIMTSGLEKYVREHSGANGEDKIENLEELVVAATKFKADTLVDQDGVVLDNIRLVELFLNSCSLSSGEDVVEEDVGARVCLMSAHAAKGKEFDAVYVIGVEEGMFPHQRFISNGGPSEYRSLYTLSESSIQEERRLLFVAASRARENLTFTHVLSRPVGNGWMHDIERSRYLKSLPAAVEEIDKSGQGLQKRGYGNQWGGGNKYSWGASKNKKRTDLEDSDDPFFPVEKKYVPKAGTTLTVSQVIVGDIVIHNKFGEGIVMCISGNEPETTITVKFADMTRMLKLSLAPLKLKG